MFVASYLGPETGIEAWNTLVSRHAADIGMRSRVTNHQLQGGTILLLTWFVPQAFECEVSMANSNGAIVFSAHPIDGRIGSGAVRSLSWDGLLRDSTENSVKLGVHPTASEIRVNVPATTPEQCYYASAKDARVLSTDMRFLVHWAGFELDELSIHSLFQFGVIPPSCSISASVRRIPAGHCLTWLPEDTEPELRPISRLTVPENEGANAEQLIENAIDRLVERTPKDSVLLFSGGVDSGLLAARFVQLARRDIRLINFAFAADDPQGKYAVQVARSLGFDCDQVFFDMRDVPDMLERIGRDYSFPFVDSSALPTNLLVEKTAEIVGEPTVVIEGTGADGEFGLGPSIDGWSRIHRVPTIARRAIGGCYDRFGFWRNAPTERIEFLVRACRQSVRYSLGADVFCQGGLDGFAYQERPDQLESAVFQAIGELTAGMSPESALSCTDMIQVCAGRFAAKSFDPLRSRGLMPLYPFLDPSILRLSLALPWSVKCTHGERKALLKRILLKSVPHEFVYRTKSGFRPPMPRIIAGDVFQDYLRNVALAHDNPIGNFLKAKNVRKMMDHVRDGRRVATGVHNFLWCLVFVSAWLNQCGFRGCQRG